MTHLSALHSSLLHSSTIATIPAPPFSDIQLGPLTVHLYGACIAVAVLISVLVAEKLWEKRGGQRSDITAIAYISIPAGILGARIYHVATTFHLYRDNPLKALAIWDGGLGIWGGVACGVLAGVWYARRKNLDALDLLDVIAPTIALAQGIGRFGNYFNQELFGKPTNLPWGLEVDPAFRPVEFLESTTFHPTFLYEAIANFAIAGLLLFALKRFDLRAGRIFSLYVFAYCTVRLGIEQLRVDTSNIALGFRLNTWTALLGIGISAYFLVRLRNKHAGQRDINHSA